MKKKAGRTIIQLPRDALRRVSMGSSFAEYDSLLLKRDVSVRTAALDVALDPQSDKCFFIGRRGTGKTAVTLLCSANASRTAHIYPQVLGPLAYDFDLSEFDDFRQKAFKSLTSAFNVALQLEFALLMREDGSLRPERLPKWAQRELAIEDGRDFDLRFLRLVNRVSSFLRDRNDKAWIKEVGKPKDLARALKQHLQRRPRQYTILVDRIDESWDGSDGNVVFLAALMHACVEVKTQLNKARVLLPSVPIMVRHSLSSKLE